MHAYKYIGEQQSSGPLYVVAVVKATPARTPVSTETVGHILQCISYLTYCITNAMYERVVAKKFHGC